MEREAISERVSTTTKSYKNRLILATRLADGMQRAFENTTEAVLTTSAVAWHTEPVSLPLARYLDKDKLTEQVKNFNIAQNFGAPEELAFVQRVTSGRKIDLGCLSVGDVAAWFTCRKNCSSSTSWRQRRCVPT